MTKIEGEKNVEYMLVILAVVAGCLFMSIALSYNYAAVNVWIVLPLGALVSIALLAAWRFPEKAKSIADMCFKYRWVLAMLVFIFCVLLRLSGSSIGVFDEIFPTQNEPKNSTIFGIHRWIRSDEFGVQTMKFFSQEYSGYSLFSNRMSLSETNMVLDYYSPVWNIAAIGKPLMWGYLLFGSEVGLSWYWCGMIILMFMASLEMLHILVPGQRWISVLGAIMITFSPAIQWWVMPHMPIVVLYSMGLICSGYWMFASKNATVRWAFAALTSVLIVGFCLSIFPSFQVPLAYSSAILIAVCLLRDRKVIGFNRNDILRGFSSATLGIAITAFVVYQSRDGLVAIMNTDYPGSRVSTGGYCTWSDLFTDLVSVFLPYNEITYLNNCEVSAFIHFAPFFALLFPRMFIFLKRKHAKDLFAGTALFIIVILFAYYMFIGIPEKLAVITLFKYCNRMKMVYGFVATLFTLWGIHVFVSNQDILSLPLKILYPLAYGAVCVLCVNENITGYFASFFTVKGIPAGSVLLAGEIVLFTAILTLTVFNVKRVLCGWLAVILFVAGAAVNPVEKGAGAVFNHPISQEISKLTSEYPRALWLCTDSNHAVSNFVLANGARVLTATNFYPDWEKWVIIDPGNEYEEYVNRYANFSAGICEGNENVLELINADYVKFSVTPQTIKELGIEYLLAAVDYTELLFDGGITCTALLTQDGYTIYHLEY